MTKIVAQVFETEDYEMFKILKDNRDITDARVRKIMASISEKYILNPIIVNEKMEIIDGQGRFMAFKALGKPVHYIIANGANSDDCRRMNKYNTKWSSLDFAKSYAAAGNRNYQLLLKTCQDTSLSLRRVLRLTGHARQGQRDVLSPFERGDLVFDENDVEITYRLKSIADDIVSALIITKQLNEAFFAAVKVVSEHELYDHVRMVENCKKCRASFALMSNLEDMLKEFERIYNYRAKKRIYFSDYMRGKGYNARDYSSTVKVGGI